LEVEQGLARSQSLLETCREIWEALDGPEQLALKLVAAGRAGEAADDALETLRLLGLISGRPAGIFSNVYEAFVAGRDWPAGGQPRRPAPRLRDPLAQPAW
jgi:hypothetical protein